MMIAGVIVLIFAISIGYFLFAPFFLEINTVGALYRVRFHWLASARLIHTGRSLIVELKIAWWHKTIDLFTQRSKKEKPPHKEVKIKRKRAFRISFRKMKAIFKSFKINTVHLTVDTGDMPLNGILYPCIMWLRIYSGKDISINFLDKNEMILEIENNCARMIWAYFKS